MAYRYPNLAAEISRRDLDYKTIYDEIALEHSKSPETVSNWITGRAGELPTSAAFSIKERFFPELSVEYLFSETPIYPRTGA